MGQCDKNLKGHGNEADFLGFCINRLGIGPLHYISSCSDFGFEFAEIFVIEKRLHVSPSRGVDKNAYRYNFFQTLNKSMVIAHYITWQVGASPTLRLAEFSFKHSKTDSPIPRLAEFGSRFSITNISANWKTKAKWLEK
jgi:hypothetical protein